MRIVTGWRGMRATARVVVMFAVGIVVAVVAGLVYRWAEAPLIGWMAAALTFILWAWLSISPLDGEQTRTHATREDPNRTVTDVLLICSNIASIGLVVVVIMDSADTRGAARLVLGAMALFGIAVSWTLVQTLFTVEYARRYYADPEGGVDFNKPGHLPSYHDFAYLAFTMGMTYQVSDTNLETTEFRRTVLRHGLLSYVFGSGILATTINLVVGLSA
jgi:uncharacterized membrane protein